MVEFALTGPSFFINIEPNEEDLPDGAEAPTLDVAQVTGLVLFSWYYIWCSIMLSILLVRLLMAMMTNTFNSVRVLATRHWRLQFARCVLQMEMILGPGLTDSDSRASSIYEVQTTIKVVDDVFTFQLFNSAD